MADQHPGDPSPAEQRAHERLPLQRNVLLIARGMSQRAGQMMDICAGGALVELREPAAADGRSLRRGEVVLLRLRLGEGEGARAHELRTRVAHVDGQLFGLSFFNPDPATVDQLLAAAGAPPAAMAPELSPGTRDLVEERLGQQLLNFCSLSLPVFFQKADDALLAAVEQARSPAEQRQFFEAATALRKQREEFVPRFLKALKASLARPLAAPEPSVTRLAESDREEFEAWLMVKVMAARVEENCRGPLTALQARLDALGHSGPGRGFRPFAPAPICLVFQSVLAPLRYPAPVEKLIYRVLEETLLARLAGLYESLNRTLLEHNVLPQLGLASAIPAATATTARAAAESSVPPASAPPQAPRTAREYLARAGLAAPSLRPRPPAPGALRELLALVRGRPALDRLDGIELRRLFAMLKAAHEGWRPALQRFVEHAPRDAVAAEVLAMAPFGDELLATLAPEECPARPWLDRVELPLLHTLASDPAFLVEVGHPMRRLLEALTLLGGRDAPLAAAQRALVEEQVHCVSRDFDNDAGVVAAATAALAPLLAAQDQAAQRNRDRVCQLIDGEQRLTDARQAVQDALDSRLAGRRVPQPVLTLLDAGWRDLLVSTRLRNGGSLWEAYLGVVDELLAIGADPRRAVDLRALLQLIKQGLDEGGDLAPQRQQQAITELRPLFDAAARLAGDTVPWVAMPPRRAGVDKGERWLEKWLDRAGRLAVGDWLELQHRGAAPERLCLAWRECEGQRFVFVNRLGQKAGDFSRQELASLLHTGNALPCFDGGSVVEAALLAAGFRLYGSLVKHLTQDRLTGLANRAEFLRQLDRALEASRRHRAHHVLARIRIDQLPGLLEGARAVAEELLRQVAHLLARPLAPRCLVARLGEGEFALLLEGCELAKAQQLLSLRMGELTAQRVGGAGEAHRLTASAGLVEVGYTSESALMLLQAAGSACDDAVRQGGNRILVYRPGMEELARRDALVVWVARLNDALEDERLALRCQRIQGMAAATAEAPLGYEILLGLQPEAGGTPPPGEFVQAAERYQRMLAVDRWVIEHAFRFFSEKPALLDRLGLVSLNLSAQSLADVQTPGFIFDRLLKYKLPPGKFCFEVSEATAIDHLADAADLLLELRRAGCRCALDDFGAGHAGSEHLRLLPLDFVKIDGAFVRAMADDADGGVLLRAINAVAHYGGLETIAENVEDDVVLERLRAIGVDHAQGYGIEKPRPLEALQPL